MDSLPTPAPRAFVTAEWRKLIMAQYAVDPSVLIPWLPPGVELDYFRTGGENRCYVSLVGFLFDCVKVKGISIPLHTRFEEVNLRFYVARNERDGTRRRGVVFIREYVPRVAISLTASWLYEEPYETLPTRHQIVQSGDALEVAYEWRHRGQWQRLAVEADPNAHAMEPGGEEEFITEHYWGYTKRNRGTTSEYPVKHPRWMAYPVRSFEVKADFDGMYGEVFAGLSSQEPTSVLLAEGSEVAVFQGRRLPA
jgi:uncharacterized protein YqjF (DUF2071 family)